MSLMTPLTISRDDWSGYEALDQHEDSLRGPRRTELGDLSQSVEMTDTLVLIY